MRLRGALRDNWLLLLNIINSPTACVESLLSKLLVPFFVVGSGVSTKVEPIGHLNLAVSTESTHIGMNLIPR